MRFRFFVFTALLSQMLLSCKEDEIPQPSAPIAGNILEVKAEGNSLRYENVKMLLDASVSSKDGYQIQQKGICFGRNAFPKINTDSLITAGPGFGAFSSAFSLPDYALDWYARPFAVSISSIGKTDTSYGNQVSIRPFHNLKTIQLRAASTDSIKVSWSGLSNCRIFGLSDVIAKGICWGTNSTPGTGTPGFFISGTGDSLAITAAISGLQPGTLYYFRAYAVNAADTIFGPAFGCSTGMLDQDNQFYPTILIGKQVWMAANLRVSRFQDGSTIEANPDNSRWDSLNTPAWGASADDAVFGKFYNYYTIQNEKNLCPAGWRIPGVSDWDSLFNQLGGWEIAGLALKAGTTAWGSSIPEGQGSSAFNALPAGKKAESGNLAFAGKLGFWWAFGSSTIPQGYRIADLDKGVFSVQPTANEGLSVRCLKKP